MRRSVLLALAAPLLLAQSPAPADEPGTPKVLYIEKELIKPGRKSAHGELIGKYMKVFGKAKVETNVLTLDPLTGDENEQMFVFPFPSWGALEEFLGKWGTTAAAYPAEFAAIEKDAGEIHARQRAMVAVLQPELSFHPLGAGVAKMRYFFVSTVRVKAGYVAQWREDTKWSNSVWEESGSKRHWAYFAIASGGEFRTFLRFESVASLAEVDAWADKARAMKEALDPESRKRWDEMGRQTEPEGGSALYAFVPSLSSVPKAWSDLDPDFWTPKPAAKPAPKKK